MDRTFIKNCFTLVKTYSYITFKNLWLQARNQTVLNPVSVHLKCLHLCLHLRFQHALRTDLTRLAQIAHQSIH